MSKKFQAILLVEGIDGTGKTTFCKKLKDRHNLPDEAFIKFPRVFKPSSEFQSKEEEIEYFLNDFKEGLAETPSADILICDRSFVTTAVYQGFDGLMANKHLAEIIDQGLGIFQGACERLYLAHLVCDITTCCERVTGRSETLRRDSIDSLSGDILYDELEKLSDRYDMTLVCVEHSFQEVFSVETSFGISEEDCVNIFTKL